MPNKTKNEILKKDYFDPTKTGGQTNSLISHQDSLAAIYAVEQLYNPDIFGFGIKIVDFSIQCETDDDFCISNTNCKIFIQVKSSKLSRKDFTDVLDSFMKNNELEKSYNRQAFFVLLVFEELYIDDKKIITYLDNYRALLTDPNENQTKKNTVKAEFEADFNLNRYTEIIDNLKIVKRPLARDDKDVPSLFSSQIRLAYGFTDQKEYLIKETFDELLQNLGQLRRNRASITKERIEEIIGKRLVKATAFNSINLLIGFEHCKEGYIRKKDDNPAYSQLENGRKKAIRRILKDWRKVYRKECILSFIFGSKFFCPKCGHPMIANMNGLNGIACPKCEFTPFVTLFSFCDCGNYEVIKAQPDLNDYNIFTYIRDYFGNEKKCSECGKMLTDDLVDLRIILAPIPYPFENYSLLEGMTNVNIIDE